jgi:REase associating with pPIWI_RE
MPQTFASADAPARMSPGEARVRAVRACALAAAGVADHSLPAARRAALLMQCHGELMAAHGPEGFPSFAAFRHGLFQPLEQLLPKGAAEGELSVTLLDEDGGLHPVARELALESSTSLHAEVPQLAEEVAQLAEVFQAVARTGVAGGAVRVLAEAVQHAVFQALRQQGSEGYTAGRERLVREPVLSLTELRRDETLAPLGIYAPIPRWRHVDGWWAPCPHCKWPMTVEQVRGEVVLSCLLMEHRRDLGADYRFQLEGTSRSLRPRRDTLAVSELRPVDAYRAVPLPVWRYITIPGLLELWLYDELTRLGATVRLWPYTDLFDLDVRVGTRLHRKVDVKVWASVYDLTSALVADEEHPADTIVIPDHQRGLVGFLAQNLHQVGLTVWTARMLLERVTAAVGRHGGRRGRRG